MDGWMKELEYALTTLGLTVKGVVVGAFASFVALQFWTGLESKTERWITFAGGWGLAAWGGTPLREWLELRPSIDVLFILLVGLFGMALVAELIKMIRTTDWKALFKYIVESFASRWNGNRNGSSSKPKDTRSIDDDNAGGPK